MMTDHELTEMVLRAMRQQLKEKMNGSAAAGFRAARSIASNSDCQQNKTLEWGQTGVMDELLTAPTGQERVQDDLH